MGATTARAPAAVMRSRSMRPDLVVGRPAGGADDEGLAARVEGQLDVGEQRARMTELEGDVHAAEPCRIGPARAAADDGHDRVTPRGEGAADGLAHVAGAGDECSHDGLVPLS